MVGRATLMLTMHMHIQAQVMENGDLFVTEARTFAFEDTVNGVYWDLSLIHIWDLAAHPAGPACVDHD